MRDDESYLFEKLNTRLLVKTIHQLLLQNEELLELLETAYENFDDIDVEGLREDNRLLKEKLGDTRKMLDRREEQIASLKAILSTREES